MLNIIDCRICTTYVNNVCVFKMVFNHIEMLQLKRYTIFALKASISLISSHNNNTMRIVVKRITHAISFKGNRYIPTVSDTQIVYNLLFQLRFLPQSLYTIYEYICVLHRNLLSLYSQCMMLYPY